MDFALICLLIVWTVSNVGHDARLTRRERLLEEKATAAAALLRQASAALEDTPE